MARNTDLINLGVRISAVLLAIFVSGHILQNPSMGANMLANGVALIFIALVTVVIDEFTEKFVHNVVQGNKNNIKLIILVVLIGLIVYAFFYYPVKC